MLQKTYSIYSENPDEGQLFIEAGKNHIACWRRQQDEKKLTAFEFFQCESYAGASFDELINAARLHSKLLHGSPPSVQFIFNTNEALCVPLNSHTNESFIKQNFDLLFGPCAGTNILSAEYADHVFASRIEKHLQDMVQSSFPGVQLHLQYACLLPGLQANGKANRFYLFFYPYYFSLIAFKEGKLQLVQTRNYSVAEDVLYFVLNVFEQYHIAKETEILIGGFIDEESKLYQTLYQYLEGLKPGEVDEGLFASDEFKNYSSHYFLPYANYVL